jgi:signal transduction histidine kinase
MALGFVVVLSCAAAAELRAAVEPQKRVLVFYSDRMDLPGNVLVDRELRAKLHERFGLGIDFHNEYVESARFPDMDYGLALRDFVRRKYAGVTFDAIIGISRPTMLFLQAYGRELFGETPIIGFGGDDVVRSWRGPPLTGVVAPLDTKGTIDLLFRLQPATKEIAVVAGASAADRRLLSMAQQSFNGERRARVTYMAGLLLEDMLDRLSTLPPQTAVFFVSMSADAAGRQFRSTDVLNQVVARAAAPVYVTSAIYLGTGAVGGVLVDQAAMAVETADLAVRVLSGERAQDIPVVETASTIPIVDVRELRRWRIDPSRLPPGASVRFEETSIWDHYKWYILGSGFICLVQGTLIAGLLIQRRRRKHAEQEAQLQRRELNHLSRVATLGELTGTLAHELSQPLTAILCTANAARRFLSHEPPNLTELRDSLNEIVEADQRASDVIHRLRGFLKKNRAQRHLVDLNLVVTDALRLARNDLLERSVVVTSHLDAEAPHVLGDRVELQQVLMNLILNACDAMASLDPARRRLSITTERTSKGMVRVAVADHGPGIPEDVESLFEPFFTSKEEGLGLGLAICRSIVSDHGGDIRAWANPEEGATFSFTLPARKWAAVPARENETVPAAPVALPSGFSHH